MQFNCLLCVFVLFSLALYVPCAFCLFIPTVLRNFWNYVIIIIRVSVLKHLYSFSSNSCTVIGSNEFKYYKVIVYCAYIIFETCLCIYAGFVRKLFHNMLWYWSHYIQPANAFHSFKEEGQRNVPVYGWHNSLEL